VFIAVFILLWVAIASAGAAIYGVRPQGPGVPWAKWVGPAFAVAALGLAIGLPALAVLYSKGPRDRTTRTGLVLTKDQLHGRDIFTTSCKKCHTLSDAEATATIGPDLDRLKPNFSLVVDAVTHGRARGNGQMPSGLADTAGTRAVADYVSRVAGYKLGAYAP
jgi:mono/diheme cytochrome c family protein